MAGTYLAPEPLILTALAQGVADLDQDISEVEEYGKQAANSDGGGDADERTHDQGEGPEKRHPGYDPEAGGPGDRILADRAETLPETSRRVYFGLDPLKHPARRSALDNTLAPLDSEEANWRPPGGGPVSVPVKYIIIPFFSLPFVGVFQAKKGGRDPVSDCYFPKEKGPPKRPLKHPVGQPELPVQAIPILSEAV